MAANIIFTILLWIAGIAGFVGVLGIIPLSVVGIVFLAKHSNENDAIKKGSLKKKGIIFLVLPWALIVGGLIILVMMLMISGLIFFLSF